ncbi:hypothetical protein KAJ83_06980 [Marivibrio halodurans]|uniref:Uncharacterized protein n=1 Tax=Marivibrio halodurans TaxID=2039722 RepID=A0A8J7SM74_9PROT|nr:hypothetical protein [Marivibrio halodurans]MBP5856746.1 hypothetical protein [Marivibrio halodurans]
MTQDPETAKPETAKPVPLPYQRLATPGAWYRGFADYLLAVPEGRPLRAMFPMPTDAAQALERHRHVLSRALLNPPMEQAIAAAIGGYARDRLKMPICPPTDEGEAIADEIDDRGWSTLPAWDDSAVERLRAALDPLPVFAKQGAARSEALSLEAARRHNVAEYKAEDLLRLPEVLSFVTEPTALAATERYLGAPPMLIALVAWWSFPGHEARDAQRFHLDIDDHRFVKHFLYLTDVDETSGPHAYVERTHRPRDYGAIIGQGRGETERKRLFEWLFQTLRKSDADVARHTGRHATRITGPAGTRFLAMTRGLHKGVAPEKRARLLIQATYGISPASAKRLADVPASALPPGLFAPPTDALLWLFVDRAR